MGWGDVISIGLGLGNMAINSSNASKLNQMKLQQAGEALYHEFITFMRNGLFNLKQAAESVLASEEESPLKAAGAMRILEYQLAASGITPDMFSELPDKEYAAATFKLINGNSNRMYAGLDKDEQPQVDQLVEHLQRLADLQYYLEHTENASRLRATKTVSNVGSPPQNKGCLIAIGLFVLGGLLVLVSAELSMFAMGAAWLVGFLALIGLIGKRRESNANQKTIKELESGIDWPRFQILEQQFTTPDEARKRQQESEQYVENFFGDYTLLQDGWRS